MTYPEAIQFLYDLRMFGAKLGLENTFELSALAGNPHKKLRFIHVAGTNGKGSTCAMLESIYRAAGLKVGLFTSPHLISFAERIQVNRELIPESDVSRLVAEMKALMAHFKEGHRPTFFEAVTVMAMKYFVDQGCELVIWETGMGGRLDATNIVTPLASVITNVQLDHQLWLGDTIEKIAMEKSGIIKPGVPVFTAATNPEALTVISDTAQRNKAQLHIVSEQQVVEVGRSFHLSLLGEHQRWNAALAMAVVDGLQQKVPVTPAALKKGLESVQWQGRCQIIRRPSGQNVLVDGAHNPAGAETLRRTVQREFPGIKPALILGILKDKDYQAICEVLATIASRIVLVPVGSERTAQPADLLAVYRERHVNVPITCCNSLDEAMRETEKEPFVVIAGSLYLAGEALEKLSPQNLRNERGLNEWSAARKSDSQK